MEMKICSGPLGMLPKGSLLACLLFGLSSSWSLDLAAAGVAPIPAAKTTANPSADTVPSRLRLVAEQAGMQSKFKFVPRPKGLMIRATNLVDPLSLRHCLDSGFAG